MESNVESLAVKTQEKAKLTTYERVALGASILIALLLIYGTMDIIMRIFT